MPCRAGCEQVIRWRGGYKKACERLEVVVAAWRFVGLVPGNSTGPGQMAQAVQWKQDRAMRTEAIRMLYTQLQKFAQCDRQSQGGVHAAVAAGLVGFEKALAGRVMAAAHDLEHRLIIAAASKEAYQLEVQQQLALLRGQGVTRVVGV